MILRGGLWETRTENGWLNWIPPIVTLSADDMLN
jgi:hypothetical protein